MISIQNLSYRYNKQKVLFNQLNLEIHTGKIYGLLGKNGAGKSTLMKMISGLLFPFEGTCMVNNFHAHRRENSFLEQLFFIPEECYLPSLHIKRFLAIYAPFYPSFKIDAFNNYLSEFNIHPDSELNKLSFGQKKKTFIAFGLAANTKLLIMDEPTNGLDIPSKIQFRKIMAHAGTADKSILLSTHQVRDLDDLISSVIIMDDSQVLLHRKKEEISTHLYFCPKQQLLVYEDMIYEEETPNGLIAMCRNKTQSLSYIDLEILFNATLSNPALINSILDNSIIN